jgi:hypothetical protein
MVFELTGLSTGRKSKHEVPIKLIYFDTMLRKISVNNQFKYKILYQKAKGQK